MHINTEYQSNHGSKLIIDGENARKEILMLIHEAKESIRIRMYMWRNDGAGNMILRALEEKISIYPNIQIFIEKDAFGSRVYNFQNIFSFGKVGEDIFSSESGKKFLKNTKNVHFSYVGSWSPFRLKHLLWNDHSKVFLFDAFTPKSRALIGGMNIADEYLNSQSPTLPHPAWWHDYMVKLIGEFADSIAGRNGRRNRKHIWSQIERGIEILATIKNRLAMRKKILRELRKAATSIIVEHGYLTDATIIRKLRQMSRKWIQVRVILPDCSDGVWHANMHSIHKLLKPTLIRHRKTSMEVFLYPRMIHAKVILIDHSLAVIGSANLTYGSFDFFHETNVIFRGREWVVNDLAIQLSKDIVLSRRITFETIPVYNRWLAWIERIFI